MKTILSLAFTTIFGTYALGLLGAIEMDRPTITIASAKTMWQDTVASYDSVAVAPAPAAAAPTRSLSFTERVSAKAHQQTKS